MKKVIANIKFQGKSFLYVYFWRLSLYLMYIVVAYNPQ